MSGPSKQREETTAAQGVAAIALAKVYFVVAGALIEFRLPMVLTNSVFGAYAVVVSTISPINNVLITGTIQAVSRYTAQTPEKHRAIQRAGLTLHLGFGLVIAIVFAGLAPLMGAFFHDSDKVGALRLAGVIAAGYAFYAVFVGTANGLRHFRKQAALDMTMATLRVAGILGLAAAGFGVMGAIGGWTLAVLAILIIASFVVGLPFHVEKDFPVGTLLRFLAGVAAYLIMVNLVMVADTWMMKRLSSEWFSTHGTLAQWESVPLPGWLSSSAAITPSTAADGQVGYYRATLNFARLSYQLTIAATFVVFPLVSRSTFDADEDASRRYVGTTIRYALIVAGAIATVLAAIPQGILSIPYGSDYAYYGSAALPPIAFGYVFFVVLVIGGTILNGAGLTRYAILGAFVALLASISLNAIVIPGLVPGRDLLRGCSIATALAMAVGAGVCGFFLKRRFGAFVRFLTVARIGFAAVMGVILGRWLPSGGALITLIGCFGVGIAFLASLALSGELSREDLRRFRSLSGSRGNRGGAQ